MGYDFIPPPARRGHRDCGRSDGPLKGKMDERDDVEKPPKWFKSPLFSILPTQFHQRVPSQPCVVSADTVLIH